jgi:hypothetical protein
LELVHIIPDNFLDMVWRKVLQEQSSKVPHRHFVIKINVRINFHQSGFSAARSILSPPFLRRPVESNGLSLLTGF